MRKIIGLLTIFLLCWLTNSYALTMQEMKDWIRACPVEESERIEHIRIYTKSKGYTGKDGLTKEEYYIIHRLKEVKRLYYKNLEKEKEKVAQEEARQETDIKFQSLDNLEVQTEK